MTKRTQHVVACASEYSGFDPLNPDASRLDTLSYMPAEWFDEAGVLKPLYCSSTSYSVVGNAVITVDFLPAKKLMEAKVAALKAEKIQVQADAQQRLTNLEQKIQSLLAISFESEQP